jgi:hypothetical protein
MKKLLLFFTVLPNIIFAQENNENKTFNWVIQPDTFYKTRPLRDIEIITDIFPEEEKEHQYKNNFKRPHYDKTNALPVGNDPDWQNSHGTQHSRAPLQNWDGMDNIFSVPDPSGAAGPNHYVQMVNSRIEIFNKTGTSLWGPNALSSILSSNDGDPIVMYDRFADRWFLSGFGTGNSLSFAVSETNDPLGSYFTWQFSMANLPDYPKYGLWHDGYYLTANKSGEDCFVLDRDAMLAGDANAQMISLQIPNLATGAGTQTGGFHSVLPSHADFAIPPASEKLNLFYFQDDAWTGVTQDEIKIWEVNVDWLTVSNSSVTEIQTLAVDPFDSQFTSSWDDINQPGTSQKIDGVPGAFMYRAQFTEWGTHNTVMLNHTVDVDATNHAGIRWYELRETGGVWSVYQQSTFAPDADSRFLGSISMDYQGNIGLAYSVSGSSTSPSLRYTGRYSTDIINSMTLAEEVIVDGSGAKSGGNRYGDYAHLSVDPDDDATFWFTGEYINNSSVATRIVSFKLASDYNNDVGVIGISSPSDGTLAGTETITVTLKNFGLDPQNNFDVSYQIDGGPVVSETYSAGPIAGNSTTSFTFSQTANLNTINNYDFKSYTSLLSDEYNQNDTLNTTIAHLPSDDIGVTIINGPITGNSITMETIQVTVENFGTSAQSNFPLSYSIDGATPITETFTGTLNAGASTTYNFSSQGDFSLLGFYDIISYSSLDNDYYDANDTTYVTIEHQNCQPSGNCNSGDGLRLVQLGTINNTTGCSTNGYEDYSDMSTNLPVGYTRNLTVESNWQIQYVSMWIDYNDNFIFESSEKVISSFQSNLGATIPFDIPATAEIGEHLIRIKSGDTQSETVDPCSDMQYGETEDYKVNLVSDVGIEEIEDNIDLEIIYVDGNLFTLKLNAKNSFSNANLKVHNTLGQLVLSKEISSETFTLDLSNMATGAYLVNVKTDTENKVIKLIKK